MTDLQINALLYDGARVEMDGFVINSWFDDETGEKNIELVWNDPLREVGFIANGMTPSELRERLEMEIRAWEMVVNLLLNARRAALRSLGPFPDPWVVCYK